MCLYIWHIYLYISLIYVLDCRFSAGGRLPFYVNTYITTRILVFLTFKRAARRVMIITIIIIIYLLLLVSQPSYCNRFYLIAWKPYKNHRNRFFFLPLLRLLTVFYCLLPVRITPGVKFLTDFFALDMIQIFFIFSTLYVLNVRLRIPMDIALQCLTCEIGTPGDWVSQLICLIFKRDSTFFSKKNEKDGLLFMLTYFFKISQL